MYEYGIFARSPPSTKTNTFKFKLFKFKIVSAKMQQIWISSSFPPLQEPFLRYTESIIYRLNLMLLGAVDFLRNNLYKYNLHFTFFKEENRNLCEDDPDKVECIREVEEAKASPGINDVQQEGKIGALVRKLTGFIFCECKCEILALYTSRKQAF